MTKIIFLILSVSFFALNTSYASAIKSAWSGFDVHGELGSTFDFELGLNKGTGLPTEALFLYGVNYAYQWRQLYVGLGLDWTIIYPRNFNFEGKEASFTKPPLSLWWIPLSNIQVGWAPTNSWLIKLGLVYYWGLSFATQYRFNEHVYFGVRGVVWMDRIFNSGGFYGGGLDNLMLAAGLGYKF
ncbi:MAG: hypothetical protein KC505_04500 [Myxococcales bacterium]|nr:hypothetical protein [Myxococcales bacterium]USN50968.1 MAG: hypothetical protein H6731_00700 [Myxococcales bacterium]